MQYRTAFITGASSGIGEALAIALARGGTEVVLAARREDLLARRRTEIEAAGGKAHAIALDVRDPDAVRRALTEADESLGGLDLVVANAGVGTRRWSGKLRYEDVGDVLDVNVKGAVATLLALLPTMVERKRGHLVGISSLAGYRATPKLAAYAASKAFLSTFLEGLRLDLRGTGVFVTDVQPGFVRTPLTEKNDNMPFAMDLDDAVATAIDGIQRRKRVVAFPWPFATAIRSSRLLPNALYEAAFPKR